jgi:hypothetical protein
MAIDLGAELDQLVKEDSQAKAAPPSDITTPTPPKEPSTYIYRTYEGDDGSKYSVYSNDGKRKAPEHFDEAINTYSATGTSPKGFTVLQPGVVDSLRKAYESVNQPIQGAAGNIGRQGLQTATAPIMNALKGMGILDQPTVDSIQQSVGGAGEATGKFAGSMVNTPEQLGTTAGSALGAAATGGTSLGLQMLGTGVGAAAGHLMGGLAGGGSPTPGDLVTTGALAAAGRGFGEVLKMAVGLGTSQLAQKGVAAKTMDLMKSKYGSAANPGVLEMMGSNPSDVAKLTGIGLDAITTELRASGITIATDIMTTMPRTLTKGAQNTLRAEVRKVQQAAMDSLEYVGNPGKLMDAFDAFDAAQGRIKAAIVQDFKGMGVPTIQKAINNADAALNTYWQTVDKYKPGATVLKALKESSAEQGFNPAAFQKMLQNYAQPPGSMMSDIGDIARRGAGYEKTDKVINASLPIGKMLNLPGFLGRLNPNKNLGTIYAGKVEGTNPLFNIGATLTGAQAVRDFASRKGR